MKNNNSNIDKIVGIKFQLVRIQALIHFSKRFFFHFGHFSLKVGKKNCNYHTKTIVKLKIR